MATSQTKTFNPDLEEIMEEAFERAGYELRTGNDFRSARRSLNYLLLEWQNKGINLWMIEEDSIASSVIADGTATYNLDQDVIDLLDVWIRLDAGTSSQSDYQMERLSSTSYAQISNKLNEGRPTRFWFQRKGITDITSGTDQPSTITLWPVPDETNKYTLVMHKITRIDDAGSLASNTLELPERFLPAIVSGLAYYVAMKKPETPDAKVVGLKAVYDQNLEEAMEEDRTKADIYITPDLSGYYA